MKKSVKKLVLSKETLRNLGDRQLGTAQGGSVALGCPLTWYVETYLAGCTQSACGPCPNEDVISTDGFC
jgi:hypothetical protein